MDYASLRNELLMELQTVFGSQFESFKHEMAILLEGYGARLELRIDRRFDAIERRLDAMDRRFDRIEARLDSIEARVGIIEGRLDRIEGHVGLDSPPSTTPRKPRRKSPPRSRAK